MKKASVFVAIKGVLTDGHKYIPNAIENGAICIFVDDFVENINICQIKVKNTREALSTASANFYDNPSKKIKVIGITATNGKTSTSMMLDAIISKTKHKSALFGTVVHRAGEYVEKSILTTPESRDLQFFYSKAVEFGMDMAIMEVSSSALELSLIHI